MIILTSIRENMPRSLDYGSTFPVLGQATASSMGGSTSAPLELNHRRTKVENIPSAPLAAAPSFYTGIQCRTVGLKLAGTSEHETCPLCLSSFQPLFLCHFVAKCRAYTEREADTTSLCRRGVCSTSRILVSVCSLASAARSRI